MKDHENDSMTTIILKLLEDRGESQRNCENIAIWCATAWLNKSKKDKCQYIILSIYSLCNGG